MPHQKTAMKAGDTARSRPPRIWQTRYSQLLKTVRELPLLAGFCYTQFADTYQERNGLLYADRTPKFLHRAIAEATTGPEFQRFEAMRLQRKTARKAGKETTMTISGGVSDRG